MFYTETLVGGNPAKTTKKKEKPMKNASPIHGPDPVPAPQNVKMKEVEVPDSIRMDAIMNVINTGVVDMTENMCRLRIMFKLSEEKGQMPDSETVNTELQKVVGVFNEMTEKIDRYVQGVGLLEVKEEKKQESSVVNKIS